MQKLAALAVDCCCDCGHERDVNPATVPCLLRRRSPRWKANEVLGVRLAKDTKPELYPGGVVALNQRLREKPITWATAPVGINQRWDALGPLAE